jgi:murein DD-endopeptidase MepM/ murein hydrolase activator NlpD
MRSNRRAVWTVILVPPRPGARTRQLTTRARTVIGIGVLALGMVAGAATWTDQTSTLAASTADRLAESQRTVVTLLDSVQVLGEMLAHERASRTPPRNMIMPVAGRISSGYARSRLHPLLRIFRPHRGVDISAPLGTRIVAPARGRVRFVGRRPGHGLVVELAHTGSVVTRFGHCRTAFVKVGDEVKLGDVIAAVGSSGLSTGPHVHFEVLARGASVDPIKFLAASREIADADLGTVDSR